MSTTQRVMCECPPHKKESVLTFDGGGIRGLAALFIVRELLMLIRTKERKRDGRSNGTNGTNGEASAAGTRELPLACHYFSFMFGTSTGGIIAIMLGRLRMDIDECIRVYRNLGTKIFAKKQPLYFLGQNKYDYKKLQKFVRDTAREQSRSPAERDNPDGLWLYDPGVVNAGELTERDRRRNRFVPCRVGVLAVQSYTQQKIHMFRSYHNPTLPNKDQDRKLLRLNLNEQTDEKIHHVAHATSAAPYYFRSGNVNNHKYLDGGLFANNPSKYAWAEANSMHLKHPAGDCPTREPREGIRFFVSIGTGKRTDQQIKGGKIRKALSLFNRGVQSMTDPEDDHSWMEENFANHDVYYRFNVETGLENMKLDDCRIGHNGHNITYHEIQAAVTEYLQDSEVRRRLETLAKQLVDNRRQKCKQQERGYRDLCVPGPLTRNYDDRFDDGDDDDGEDWYGDAPNSPVNTTRSRTGSVQWPRNGTHELHSAPMSEMPASASLSELYPQSPPQSPTVFHDTPVQIQEGFSTHGPPKPQSPLS